ncbi:MAG TPA: PD-(D/E)XK nuclease family protein [Candidatus Binataceae bacterium]|nr:PD-(D/E)XK nuclease family protein [Candidatus Binataceae bacterium]
MRLAAAREWLTSAADGSREILLLAAHPDSADDLVRNIAATRGALAGVHRLTPNRLIAILAADQMAAMGLAPATSLATEAVAARAVFQLKRTGRLAWFEPVLDRPGFPRALARSLGELRLNRISATALEKLDRIGPPLAALLAQFEAELAAANLADRAAIVTMALAAIAAPDYRLGQLPLALIDLPIETALEADLIAALAAQASSSIATVPDGDDRAAEALARIFGDSTVDDFAEHDALSPDSPALIRLQHYLFAGTQPPAATLDESVTLESATGEMQECVAIARRIHAESTRGIPFDRIAVVLHSPGRYVAHLEEALDRAGIPACFVRGASRPEPGGRALLTLLACAAENLSARRFAEFLSLAQLRDPDAPAPPPDATAFVPPNDELGALTQADAAEPVESASTEADPVPVVDVSAHAPWRWEKLLVDAAVIGSRDRWDRRLAGLETQLRLQRAEAAAESGEARAAALDRQLLDLAHLRALALPVIDALASRPPSATWATWLEYLRDLTARFVRDRDPVLAVLAELAPMGPVGPITLDEVRIVLGERLGNLERPRPRRRYGAVFVATPAQMRGMEFDVTIVPGLVERVFPRKLIEDPLLPDSARRQLDHSLPLQADRTAAERLALRLTLGSARDRVALSYPRVDLDQGRPRVPSFYALEVLRAAEGRLPGFDELARRAAGDRPSRLGWPVPLNPTDAIDDAEFDLAVLDKLLDANPDTTVGAAHYLLDANPHLGRALRARARRWLRRWTPNDGLVDPSASERAALDRHQLAARSYSPTALQNFASCPYRFFLQAIHRLEPREEPEAIEVIDPLTRGALFHEVQFELLTELRASGQLPVTEASLANAHTCLDRLLDKVALKYHDDLAPAIERVWIDGIDSIRADLREWVRRMATDPDGWRPDRFELAFGLRDRDQADPASTPDPIVLSIGLTVRGSIDLVERGIDGALRVTDHKTGRVRAAKNVVIGGGKTLQPLIYALAVERILASSVTFGRLYYCTAAGGYEDRVVTIDDVARKAGSDFTAVLKQALTDGFLPAAPDQRECLYCDYRRVCGPYEEMRVRHKVEAKQVADRLSGLTELRSKP